jgi:hypothetical protein
MSAAPSPQPDPHSQTPQIENVKNVKKRKRTPENHPFRFKKKPKPEFPAKVLEGVGKALLEASRACACATPSADTPRQCPLICLRPHWIAIEGKVGVMQVEEEGG